MNILKRIFFLLLFLSLSASEQSEDSNLPNLKTMIITGTVGVGITGLVIISAPYVLPAGTIIAIKAGVAAAATKAAFIAIKTGAIAAAPVAQGIGTGLFVARQIRPYFFPNNEQNRDGLLQKRVTDSSKAKAELSSCLINNKARLQGYTLHMPTVCEEAAIMFEMLAGQEEFNKMIRKLTL